MKTSMFLFVASILTMTVFLVSCSEDATEPESPRQLGWAVGGTFTDYGVIFHTQDGGATWAADSLQLPNSGDLNDVCIIDEHRILLVGGDVFKSVDGGTSWTASGPDDPGNLGYTGAFALDENNIWIVGAEGRIYYSTDVAESWTKIDVPVDYQEDELLRIAAKSEDDIWVVGSESVSDSFPIMLHTTDGGTNWERLNPIKDLDVQVPLGGYFLGIELFGNSVWAVGNGQFVIRSADDGATWENVSPGGGLGDSNDLFLLSDIQAYVVEDYGQIYSTDDAGQTWTEYYPPTVDWLVGITILDNTDIWTCGSGGGQYGHSEIWYSPDAGTTWQDQTPQLLLDNPGWALYKIRFIETD